MKLRLPIYLLTLMLLSSCSKPIASFILDQSNAEAPSTVQLSNTSENADTYNWDFGDGNRSTDPSPEHIFELSGRYKIKLEAIKNNKKSFMEKEIIVEAPKECKILVKTTLGDMVFLLSDKTPEHRDNFIKLVNDKYYDGLIFHRVVAGFMIQGGDPDSKGAGPDVRLGSGGPGYTIPAEFNPELVHTKGAIAAARTGDNVNPNKRSSGSQFYVVHGREVGESQLEGLEKKHGNLYSEANKKLFAEQGGTPFLDHDYTVFGHVVEGFDVLDIIATTKTAPGDRPIEDVIIEAMTVIK